MTPLRGADGEVYAMAQGSMVVSGFGISGKDGSRVSVNVPSSGRVPNGATVEREVGTHFGSRWLRDAESQHAGFHHRCTAERAVDKLLGDGTAQAIDAVTVRVKGAGGSHARVAFVGALQELEVEPGDAPARVIINSRTGTVVIGSHVRVMPAAVAHGSLSVTITERTDVSQPKPFSSRHHRRGAAFRDHHQPAQRCAHVPVQRRRRSRGDRARGEPGGRRSGRPGGDPRGAAAGRRAACAADRDLGAQVRPHEHPRRRPDLLRGFQRPGALKKSAKAEDPQAIRQAARQFESLLTNMLLKSMRDARLSDSLGDSEQTQFYQDMFDQQLSVQMSQGKGMGLADMLMQQLTRSVPTAANAAVGAVQQHDFIQRLAPYAEQAARTLGVSSDALIAQAALETGWGQHMPGGVGDGTSSNLFGVKAGGHWQGDAVSAQTVEFTNTDAQTLQQPFRSYRTIEQSIADYVGLLQGSARYQHALGTGDDVAAFAQGLKRGGYATDPAYVEKLTATAGQVRALRADAQDRLLKLAAGRPSTHVGEIA
jgi:flagellar protein FlgJ